MRCGWQEGAELAELAELPELEEEEVGGEHGEIHTAEARRHEGPRRRIRDGLWPAGLRPAGRIGPGVRMQVPRIVRALAFGRLTYSCRAQRGATGHQKLSLLRRSFVVQQSRHAVLHQRDVEIQQQSYWIPRQFEVSQQLRLVNRKDNFNSLQFHHHLTVHHQIDRV